jgi:flagellin
MIINHNIAALNTNRQLSVNTTNSEKSLEKLSSGLRINKAGDDAAGLAISEKMRGQIRGLSQATSNAQDGISLIQTAEGALNETHSILQRMRELAVQSANDTNTNSDRSSIQQEIDQLAKEITRVSNTTEFNTKNLLAGGLTTTFQIGANKDQNINLSVVAMDAQSLGVARNVNQVGTFAAVGTGITATAISNSDLGNGLVGGATYGIKVTNTAATATAGASTFTGATSTDGAYTGARDASNVIFKATAVSGAGDSGITAGQYSTDGGTTWTSATITQSGTDSVFNFNGAKVGIADNAANAVGNTVNVSFTAKVSTLQLSGAAVIGSAVTAYSDMTSVTIGDTATGQTMTVHNSGFTFGSLTAGTATQGVVSQNSAAAVLAADGSVTTGAVAQGGIDVSTQAAANTAITTINTAITTVSSERSKLGAYQNRLEHTINNLSTSSENLTSAESRIRDVDMAKEMTNFTKNSILNQAAQAMLAQANQLPQGVLSLLK